MFLNKIQKKIKTLIEAELVDIQLKPCVVCKGTSFEQLSPTDKHGLTVNCGICKTCGLVQLNPIRSLENYNVFYTKYYKHLYTGRDMPDEGDFKDQYKRGKRIYDFINQVEFKNKSVCEIGTSCGGVLKYFKEKGWDVTGYDLDEEYVNYGKTKGLNLRVGSIKDITGSYDLIIYSHVLEHIYNPIEELIKVKSLLKEGGALYVEVPGLASEESYKVFIKQTIQMAHIYYFTLNTLYNVMKCAGYTMKIGNDIIQSLWAVGPVAEPYNRFTSTIYTLDVLKAKPNRLTMKKLINPIKRILRKNKLISRIYYDRLT